MSEAPGIVDSEVWVDGFIKGTGTKLHTHISRVFKTPACTLFKCLSLSAAQYRICRILVIAILFISVCSTYGMCCQLVCMYCTSSDPKLFMHLLISG